jgi:O-acetyl-ADP-ribose deacetylase (regulator of RNase III)
VDGAIHSTAGPDLLKACRRLGGCETGSSKMTDAFKVRLNIVNVSAEAGGRLADAFACFCVTQCSPDLILKRSLTCQLPSKRISHTVGPVYDRAAHEKSEELLRSCYHSCLQATVSEKLKTIVSGSGTRLPLIRPSCMGVDPALHLSALPTLPQAFCSISTGVYGFPIDDATRVALDATRNFLSSSEGSSVRQTPFPLFSLCLLPCR